MEEQVSRWLMETTSHLAQLQWAPHPSSTDRRQSLAVALLVCSAEPELQPGVRQPYLAVSIPSGSERGN